MSILHTTALACLAGLAAGPALSAQAGDSSFTPRQRAELRRIVKEAVREALGDLRPGGDRVHRERRGRAQGTDKDAPSGRPHGHDARAKHDGGKGRSFTFPGGGGEVRVFEFPGGKGKVVRVHRTELRTGGKHGDGWVARLPREVRKALKREGIDADLDAGCHGGCCGGRRGDRHGDHHGDRHGAQVRTFDFPGGHGELRIEVEGGDGEGPGPWFQHLPKEVRKLLERKGIDIHRVGDGDKVRTFTFPGGHGEMRMEVRRSHRRRQL